MRIKLLLSILFLLILKLHAELKVCPILGDNMVLQRNTEVKLWGKANPNEKIKIATSWDKFQYKVVSNDKGEWIAKIKTLDAGGPYSITITTAKERLLFENILLGEVWVCSGQSNMEMPIGGYRGEPVFNSNDILAESNNTNIRLFNVKKASLESPQDTCSGAWKVASAESVAPFSAVGYLYAKQLQRILHVPIGIISTCWGGTRIEAWISKDTLSKYPEGRFQNRASQLYNGMISPIKNYTIKGVIWYQGESNIVNYNAYASLMSSMVANWRTDFGIGTFPFYYVQIAPYTYSRNNINSALQRDEQLKCMSLIPNSGIVSTIDIGDENSIHPPQKEVVAKRLSYWALSETYDFKGISFKSPTFKGLSVKDSVAFITFNNEEKGLTSFGKNVECFEVAGPDSVFHPATMSIIKGFVNVRSSHVKTPIAVRYGFSNFPKTSGYLYNSAGLPVPSFRTDNWMK